MMRYCCAHCSEVQRRKVFCVFRCFCRTQSSSDEDTVQAPSRVWVVYHCRALVTSAAYTHDPRYSWLSLSRL